MQQLDLYIKGKHILMRKLEKYEANKLNFSITDTKFKGHIIQKAIYYSYPLSCRN